MNCDECNPARLESGKVSANNRVTCPYSDVLGECPFNGPLGGTKSCSDVLGECPFNGPLGGTKYPTRAASPIQIASTPKSSLPFSKHRSCAQVLV